jgi:multicomponent Na+:H+ antiporter subunit A
VAAGRGHGAERGVDGGLPPLVGFIAKEKGLDAPPRRFRRFGRRSWWSSSPSILTFAYSVRFVLGVLGRLGTADHDPISRQVGAPPTGVRGAGGAARSVLILTGSPPCSIDRVVRAATVALDPGATPRTVVLWAGFNTAFVLSLVIIALGTALVGPAPPGRRVPGAFPRRRSPGSPTATRVFCGDRHAARLTVAKRLTAVVQNGSLPIYLAVIVSVAALLPLAPALTEFPALPELVDVPVQIPLAALVIAAALGAAITRRRISAAL